MNKYLILLILAYFYSLESDAQLSYPGTNFCGFYLNVTAKTKLGVNNETDACCRTRYECEPQIEPNGENKQINMTNPSSTYIVFKAFLRHSWLSLISENAKRKMRIPLVPSAKYPCDCEKHFYQCLKTDADKKAAELKKQAAEKKKTSANAKKKSSDENSDGVVLNHSQQVLKLLFEVNERKCLIFGYKQTCEKREKLKLSKDEETHCVNYTVKSADEKGKKHYQLIDVMP